MGVLSLNTLILYSQEIQSCQNTLIQIMTIKPGTIIVECIHFFHKLGNLEYKVSVIMCTCATVGAAMDKANTPMQLMI